MKSILAVLICLAIFFSSCNILGDRIKGNGVVRSETRSTGAFTSIHVSGNIDVYVRQDSASSVRVEADENLMEYIQVSTDGNTLRIKPKDNSNLKSSKGIKVYVSNPSYTGFEVSGACELVTENKINSPEAVSVDISGASELSMQVNAPKITAEISGASKMTLSGETRDLLVDCAGASKVKCFELMTENAEMDLSGASSGEVFASVKLDADASGASHIKYKGNASVIQQSSGAGSISKVD